MENQFIDKNLYIRKIKHSENKHVTAVIHRVTDNPEWVGNVPVWAYWFVLDDVLSVLEIESASDAGINSCIDCSRLVGKKIYPMWSNIDGIDIIGWYHIPTIAAKSKTKHSDIFYDWIKNVTWREIRKIESGEA